MGYGPGVSKVMAYAARHRNIHYQPAVPTNQVLKFTAGADVGLFILPRDSCLSYHFSLGNKFFQYLRAGLPILVTDNPEMSSIVRDHDCGWVYSGHERELAALIDSLSINDIRQKQARAIAAGSVFTWAREESSLRLLYEALFDIPTDSGNMQCPVAA
jgi:glycosyltransferase involved in cell wall biosynthesis